MVAQKVEAALDPADEGLVGVLLQIERLQRLVDHLHRAAQLPAGRRENEDVVHEADVEQGKLGRRRIERVEKEASDQWAQRAAEQTVTKGAGLLAVYSARLGIPFVIAAFAIEPFAGFLARFRRHLHRVEQVMGVLLVLTGIAFLTGFVSTASFWLLEVFPVLGKIG